MSGCVGILIGTVHYLRAEGLEILRGALINWQVVDAGPLIFGAKIFFNPAKPIFQRV